MLHISFSSVLSCWMMAAPPLLPPNSAIATPWSPCKNLSISSRWESFHIKDWRDLTEKIFLTVSCLVQLVFWWLSQSIKYDRHRISFMFYQPSTESASCSTSSAMTGGPIISDVTEISQSTTMALQMQAEESRWVDWPSGLKDSSPIHSNCTKYSYCFDLDYGHSHTNIL